jgi:hypothetical protein
MPYPRLFATFWGRFSRAPWVHDGVMPSDEPTSPLAGVGHDPLPVFVSGKRVDAKLIAGMLRSCGIYAEVWTSGLQPWATYAAPSEMTGVPNDFGSNRVMVRREDASLALQLVASPPIESDGGEAS